MITVTETRLPFAGVRSLVWVGDTLIDWINGGRQYHLDGSVSDGAIYYGNQFDGARHSPGGEYTVIYTQLGTKGLVLRNGQLVREINRSYYYADAYEYPVALLRLNNGREAIVHCPDEYNRLEIDDLETGARLTQNPLRAPSDFFHSRLDVSPDGKFLVSAGWYWHPIDVVQVYDLAAALADPTTLDGDGMVNIAMADESSAAFVGDGRLAVALNEIDYQDQDGRAIESNRAELRVFDLQTDEPPRLVSLDGKPGTIAGVGPNHVLALFEFPRLIDLDKGTVVRSWPHIRSGKQTSSILAGAEAVPPLAFDHAGRRLAVADAEGITVLAFS